MTPEHTALVARLEASYPAAYSQDVAAAIAAIRALAGEVERLRERFSAAHSELCASLVQVDTLRAEVAALSADLENVQTENDQRAIEVAALKPDAERYRWLRDTPPWRSPVAITHAPLPDDTVYLCQEHLDAAIDAALADKPLSGPTP